MVGLGKLGLPVAYAMAARGLHVYGYDSFVSGPPDDTSHEQGLAEIIEVAGGRMHFCDLTDVVNNTNVIFVAVQTPHEPRFEGVTPLPEDRADFDYSFLIQACKQISRVADALEKNITLAVISTVLPGTMDRYIRRVLSERVALVYNPSFIAMGTTVQDFLDPEFVLLGGDDRRTVWEVYSEVVGDAPVVRTSVKNAELIKVSYNTFIGLKIAFANTLMEVCHKTGCDVDEVTGALKMANRRLISPAYLDGGMGDGGGCHPRDNIALSWLARELDLSFDLFGAAMEAREAQAEWLCDLMEQYDLPKGIVGLEYKPGSRIKTGSAAVLIKNLLEARGHRVHILSFDFRPRVWLVGCQHPHLVNLDFPRGSVVIDPFRYIPDQDGVEVIRLGWAPAHTDTSASTTPRLAV
jgi:UDPglucose 6-dehydrogenase